MSGQVDESLLKGNYGEHLVTLILSSMCLVRPVVGHTDVGVDLYCESVIDSKPFLHFWGQVKSEKDFPNEETEVPCSFRVLALQYWSRQPVPVLGFLVPLKWPPEEIQVIVEAYDPLRVLARGYSITRDKTGKAIRDAARVTPGQEITTYLAKGQLRSAVTETATTNSEVAS